jgi:hypothetical protein
MVKITLIVLLMLGAVMVAPSRGQSQSAADMQAQENAADSQVSTSGTATYTTPYKLFQKFYLAFTGTSSALTFSYLTQNGVNKWCEQGQTSPPLTSAQFSAMDAGKVNTDEKDYALTSFKFTADSKNPKITVVITFTRKDPASTNRLGITDTDELTLVDTPMGWMIDAWNSY